MWPKIIAFSALALLLAFQLAVGNALAYFTAHVGSCLLRQHLFPQLFSRGKMGGTGRRMVVLYVSPCPGGTNQRSGNCN